MDKNINGLIKLGLIVVWSFKKILEMNFGFPYVLLAGGIALKTPNPYIFDHLRTHFRPFAWERHNERDLTEIKVSTRDVCAVTKKFNFWGVNFKE